MAKRFWYGSVGCLTLGSKALMLFYWVFAVCVWSQNSAGNLALSKSLQLTADSGSGWKSVAITLAPAVDLSKKWGVIVPVHNSGLQGIAVFSNVDNDKSYPSNQGYAWVEAGETDTLYVHFHRAAPPPAIAQGLKGMNGMPGGYTYHWETIEADKVSQISLSVFSPQSKVQVAAEGVYAWGDYWSELPANFFPFIDTLGQYRHQSWPGKTASITELQDQAILEAADLKKYPGPSDWDAYGGWAAGPQLTASGRFRTEKNSGRWWLVDPDGHLFWSQGINCVSTYQATTVTGREAYFQTVPSNGDFLSANCLRKYGSQWPAKSKDIAHQRLRSWGMNTIANWSDKGIFSQAKTPYVVNVSSGVATAMPADLDTAALRSGVRTQLVNLKKQIGDDPFCLGVFIDNELKWPATNTETVATAYFRICSQEVHAALPGLLYLGSRLHVSTEVVWRAAALYCDIISHNRYTYTMDIPLPTGVDKPVLITEYHFGALDRGLPHPGLKAVFNQRQRARAFGDMVRQGLASPNIVGAHWFQYADQAYTGRSDGENYQIGFIDVTDKPYPEMVAMARQLGGELYPRRVGASLTLVNRKPSQLNLGRGVFPNLLQRWRDALGRRLR